MGPALSLSIARQLLVTSFLLSQGDPSLQENLFHYVHVIRPSWHVSDALRKDLERQLAPVQTRISQGTHSEIEQGEAPGAVRSAAWDMQAILNGEHLFEYEGLPVMGEIIMQVIEREHLYLVRLGKRPRDLRHWRHHLLQYTPLYRAVKDAHLSHLCHFAVLGKDAGMPEFNQMFDEMRGHLHGSPLLAEVLGRHFPRFGSRPYSSLLEQVVAAYNLTHYDWVFVAWSHGTGGGLGL